MDVLSRTYEPYHTHLFYTLGVTLLAWAAVIGYCRLGLRHRPDQRVLLYGLVIGLPVFGEIGSYIITILRPPPSTYAGHVIVAIHAWVLAYVPLDPILDLFIPPGEWRLLLVILGALALISLLRWMYGALQFRRVFARAQPLGQSRYRELADHLRDLAQSSQRPLPPVFVIDLPTPFACAIGFAHSRIYLSTTLLDLLADDERLAVLCHEWAHVLRHDLQWNAVVRVLRDLTCFLPGSHIFWRAMLCSQDEACDALAARITQQPLSVARALVKLAAWQTAATPRLPGASLFSLPNRSPVFRVQHMLRLNKGQDSAYAPGAYVVGVALILLAVLPALLGC